MNSYAKLDINRKFGILPTDGLDAGSSNVLRPHIRI